MDGKTIALKLDTHYSILNNGGGVSTMQNRSGVSLPCGNSAIVHLGTITVRERFETRVPALSTLPYLDRLFRTTGIGSVEQDVYQIVTVRIVKEAQPVKSSCTATKPVVVPKQTFSCGIGWFGGQ